VLLRGGATTAGSADLKGSAEMPPLRQSPPRTLAARLRKCVQMILHYFEKNIEKM